MNENLKKQIRGFLNQMEAIKEAEDRAISEPEALGLLGCSYETLRRWKKKARVREYTLKGVKRYSTHDILRLGLIIKNQKLIRQLKKEIEF